MKDAGAPTGEISIGTNKWNSFLNTITFGLFFKKTEQVTITAQDQESGVASVSYYKSDSALSEEEVRNLDDWTAGNTGITTFSISKDESCVVYAKITDYQGNVTYISSDGLVFDGTPPSITGVTDGETYCTPQTVTVTDDNLESVTVDGKAETLSDGKFTLDVKFDTTTIVIAAADKAGNVTTVTVNVGHNYGIDWKSDSNGHWHECVVCGDKSEVLAHTEDSGSVTKPATETETGIRTYKCSVCGYEMRTEIIEKLPPSHTHSYGTEWKSDSNSHWHECDCGEKSDSATHTEDSGTVTKPATETETGIRTYKCSVCGYEMRTEIIEKLPPSHTHSYGTEWKSDDSNHWHECDCGEKNGTAAHTWDSGTVTVQPTTDREGEKTFTCTVCGRTRTETLDKLPQSHTHSYGTEWKSDDSNHWHDCACGEKSGTAAHTWDSGTVTVQSTTDREGEKTFTCTVCGRTKTETLDKLPPSHTHSYGTEWKSDSNNHWHECDCGDRSGVSAHTEDGGSVTKAPTEAEKGVRAYKCSVCGHVMRTEEIEELPPSHTHSYRTEWKSDADGHWHECACGDRSGVSAHTEDGGSVTKESTETEKGVRTYKCSVCGHVMRTEEIEELPPSHMHSYRTEWKSDADGHWHECVCGDRSGVSTHAEDGGSVTKEPTETEKGVRTYKCSVCGYVMRTEEIEKLPPSHTHSYGTGWKSDADGHWHECACGDKSDAAVHTEDSGIVTKEPTETEKGVSTYKCSVCGYVMRTEEIEELPPKPGSDDNSGPDSDGDSGPDSDDNSGPDISAQGAKQPFIKGEDGKVGWNVIRAKEEQAQEGSIINIDMNGSAVVPGDIFSTIRGRNITVTFDMGNGILWSVDGSDITVDRTDDIDFSVRIGTNIVPADIISNVAGGNWHMQLNLAYEGEFGFTAVLSLNLGRENAGRTAKLYYYNESTGKLELVSTNEVAGNGTAELVFTHASDYVIVVDEGTEGDDVPFGSIPETPIQDAQLQNPAGQDAQPQNPAGQDAQTQNPAGQDAQLQNPAGQDAQPQNPPEQNAQPQNPAGQDAQLQNPAGQDAQPQNLPEQNAQTQDPPIQNAQAQNPQAGQSWRALWIVLAVMLVIVIGVGIFFVRKKGKEDVDGGQQK